MNKRPRSITVISWIFLAAGFIGLAYHATEFNAQSPFEYDVVWVCFVRLLAIVCGVFLLYGCDWARWLLLLWLAYHILLSISHSLFAVAVHGLLFAVIAYFLFRPQASRYFRGTRPKPPRIPDTDA